MKKIILIIPIIILLLPIISLIMFLTELDRNPSTVKYMYEDKGIILDKKYDNDFISNQDCTISTDKGNIIELDWNEFFKYDIGDKYIITTQETTYPFTYKLWIGIFIISIILILILEKIGIIN